MYSTRNHINYEKHQYPRDFVLGNLSLMQQKYLSFIKTKNLFIRPSVKYFKSSENSAVEVMNEFTFRDTKFSITLLWHRYLLRFLLHEETSGTKSFKYISLEGQACCCCSSLANKSHYPTPDFHETCFLAGYSIALTLVFIHSSPYKHSNLIFHIQHIKLH